MTKRKSTYKALDISKQNAIERVTELFPIEGTYCMGEMVSVLHY